MPLAGVTVSRVNVGPPWSYRASEVSPCMVCGSQAVPYDDLPMGITLCAPCHEYHNRRMRSFSCVATFAADVPRAPDYTPKSVWAWIRENHLEEKAAESDQPSLKVRV